MDDLPTIGRPELRGDPESEQQPLLQVRDLVQTFAVHTPGQGKRTVQAVSGVSLTVHQGDTLALVGETGCGKSSLIRSILQMPKPKSGEVLFKGQDLVPLRGPALRSAMSELQVVFQDPFSSLDPRWNVMRIVGEPLAVRGIDNREQRTRRVEELLDAVGLDPRTHGHRRPRELSGGQCQRVAIARALALHPSLLICDEAVSSLDVSVQAQILNLFEDLRRDFDLSYLFITHDLSVARHVSNRIAVMYLGKIVEMAPSLDLFASPSHPYSKALLSSIPDLKAGRTHRARLAGEIPSPLRPPSGCRFHTRCPIASEVCRTVEPALVEQGGRKIACHFPLRPDVADIGAPQSDPV